MYSSTSELMTIVFIGFDGYHDLWNDCISLFKKNWNDCPFRIFFVNNELECKWEGVEVLHAGKDAEWSRKVQVALNYAKSEYICLLLEDFFVGRQIKTELFLSILNLIQTYHLRYYKLANLSRFVINKDLAYEGFKYLHVIPKSDEYGISLQAAIWERHYLETLVGNENYNAWVFEYKRVAEAEGKKKNELQEGCVFDDRNPLELFHGVVQGKYIPSTIEYFNSIGYKLNIERPVLSKAQYFRTRLISKLKYCLPKQIRKPVKSILEKIGFIFVSTKMGTKKRKDE